MNVPAQAYQDYARGKLSKEDLTELEKMADALSKESGISMGTVVDAAGNAAQHVGRGASFGLGLAGSGLAGLALTAGAQSVYDKLTYRRDLNRLLDVRPEIKENYSQRDIDLAYQSMRTLNPDFAKDPLTGSTLLDQILRNRDRLSPSSAPRMDLGVARELYTAERKGRDPMQDVVVRAFQTGGEFALRDHLESQKLRAQAEGLAASKMQEMLGRAWESGEDRDFRREQAEIQHQNQMDLEGVKADHARETEVLKARLRELGPGQGFQPSHLAQRRSAVGLPPVVPASRMVLKGVTAPRLAYRSAKSQKP